MARHKKPKILPPGIGSYHGRVHIPYISTKPQIFSDPSINFSTCCANHIIAKRPEKFSHDGETKTDRQKKDWNKDCSEWFESVNRRGGLWPPLLFTDNRNNIYKSNHYFLQPLFR